MEGRLAQRDGREDRGSGEGAGPGGLGPWWRGHGLPVPGPPGLLQLEVRLRDETVLPSSCTTSPWCSCCAREVKLGHQVKPPGKGGRLRGRGCVFPVLLNAL